MVLTKKKNMSRKQNLKSRKHISKSRKNGLKSKKNMRGSGKFGNKFKGIFGSSSSPLKRTGAMTPTEASKKRQIINQSVLQQKVEVEPKQPNILHRIAQSVGSTTKGMQELH